MQSAQSGQLPFKVGVPQGDPLSPQLSAQYIAPILKKLFKFDLSSKTQSLFFVDDGVILVSSPSLHLNNSLLREHFMHLRSKFLSIGLVLEASKTELMHFSHHELTRRGKPLYRGDFPPLDLGIAPFTGTTLLKPTMRWRYLGYYFDPYLSYDHHIDFYVNKAYSML